MPTDNSTTAPQATCAERITDHLASRAEDVRKMLAAQSGATLCKYCGQKIKPAVLGSEGHYHVATSNRRCDGLGEAESPRHSLVAEPDEDYDEDTLSEFGLSLSRKVVLRFDMSTGGPADWLEVLCDQEWMEGDPRFPLLTVERVTYHFADWFDHAEQVVEEGSPLYDLAEWLAEAQG